MALARTGMSAHLLHALNKNNLTSASRISPITDSKISLSVKSGEMENKNTIKLYDGAKSNTNNSSMWYLRLADGASSPVCPDVGKAPTNENSKF